MDGSVHLTNVFSKILHRIAGDLIPDREPDEITSARARQAEIDHEISELKRQREIQEQSVKATVDKLKQTRPGKKVTLEEFTRIVRRSNAEAKSDSDARLRAANRAALRDDVAIDVFREDH